MTATTSSSQRLLLPGQPLSVSSKPGQVQLELGQGTYSRGDYILSSLVGYETRTPSTSSTSYTTASSSSSLSSAAAAEGSTTKGGKREVVSISGVENRFVVPRPESIVIGRVTRVTPRQVYVSILIVDGQACGTSSTTLSSYVESGLGNHAAGEEGIDFQGVIRTQDVRTTEKDKVKMAESFRPGDIVRAIVISLGDARSYYLSTASNNLGVIYALSSTSTSVQPEQQRQLNDESSTSISTITSPGWKLNGNPMVPISWNQMIDPITGIVENRKCAKPDSL